MSSLPLRAVLLLSGLVAGGALFAAHAAEWWGGLVPCALCLAERWPYRLAVAGAALGLVLPARTARWCAAAVVLAMLGGAGLAAVHVGVEAHWWPSPLPECAARLPTGATLAERLAQMPERPAKPCDEPTFPLPGVPVSMAALNLLFSAGFATTLAAYLISTRRSQP